MPRSRAVPEEEEEEEENIEDDDGIDVQDDEEEESDGDNEQTQTYDDVVMISQLLAEVDSKMDHGQIEDDIREFANHADVSEWRGIPKYFDALASVTSLVSTYNNWPMRFRIAEYLISCSGTLKDAVIDHTTAYITARNAGKRPVRDNDLVTALTMFVVLVQRVTCQLQLHVAKTGKTKKRNQADNDDDTHGWLTVQRNRMINCLCDILQLEVEVDNKVYKNCAEYVWKPEVMDPDFLKVIADTAFGVLDDPELLRHTSQTWLQKVFTIVKILSTDYKINDELSKRLLEKTMNLDYLKESTATCYPFIEPLIALGYADGGRISSSLRPLLENITARSCAISSCHFSSHKPIALMIQALGEKIPDIVLLNINVVFSLLSHDSATLRSAGLNVISDLLKSEFLSSEICKKFENRLKQRNLLLKRMVSHLRDQNAPTRAKALHLLTKLMDGGVYIPAEFQSKGILTLVGRRMNDKSVMVRKNAVQFLTTFLVYNHFGHDFNRQMVCDKLVSLIKEKKLLKNPANSVVEEVEARFAAKDAALRVHVRNQCEVFVDGGVFGDLVIEGMDLEENLEHCLDRLLENPAAAVTILMHVYAKKCQLPILEDKSDPERCKKEMFEWLYNKMSEDYINNEIRKHHLNDEQIVLEQQRSEDFVAKQAEIDEAIEMCKNKLVVEEELRRCVDFALRSVLNGELSEMKESIKFLAKCKQFNVRDAESAIRSMCSLIWKNSPEIKKELLEAAAEMFISTYSNSHEKEMIREDSTVANMMNAMNGISKEERASVEEVIFYLAEKDLFSKGIVAKLWTVASAINRDDKYRIDALRLIYSISRSEFGVIESRNRLRTLQRMLSLGTKLAYEALRVVSVLYTPTTPRKPSPSDCNAPLFRIPNDDSFFKSLEQLFFHEVLNESTDQNWFGVMQISIICIIRLAKDVNLLLPQFAAGIMFRARRAAEFYMFYKKEAENSTESRRAVAAQRRDYWEQAWVRITERLVAFVGEVAVRIHGFIQTILPKIHSKYEAQMKYARTEQSKTVEEPARFLTEFEMAVARKTSIFDYTIEGPQENSENFLSEVSQLVSDVRVLKPQRLLGRMLPIVVYAMRAKGMPERIRHHASLAFGKYMTLSSHFAEFAAPTFFTIMSRSPYSLVRCNMLAACSDFALAQPSLFEMYAPTLYRMARDADAAVRESTILVLSHLTAMEMVQMRGALAEPARCLCDDVASVQSIAASFFSDLNRRGTDLIELLPEFIYRLACTGERLPYTQYQQIFEFLITLTRDKPKPLLDTMIDKVTAKFAALDSNLGDHPEAPRYLAFAMSKFTLTDSGFYKFRDCIRHWSRFLNNKHVANTVTDMITVLMKNTKSEEVKIEAEELIVRIGKIRKEGLTAEVLSMPIHLNRKPAPKGRKGAGGTPQRPAAKKRARQPVFSDSD